MAKAETFRTVTDCHHGCREDTKSSLLEGVICIRSKFACLYRGGLYRVRTFELLQNHVLSKCSVKNGTWCSLYSRFSTYCFPQIAPQSRRPKKVIVVKFQKSFANICEVFHILNIQLIG